MEYVPAAQVVQVDEEVAPTADEDVPAAQFVHGGLPVADQVPPEHADTHAAEDVDPAGEYGVGAVQAVHVEAVAPPVEYELASQGPLPAEEEAPARQYKPAGQDVPVAEVAPGSQYVPALHWPVGVERPVVAQYDPAVQGVHPEVDAPPAE